jgi:uncharacterized protein (DUF2147 family)
MEVLYATRADIVSHSFDAASCNMLLSNKAIRRTYLRSVRGAATSLLASVYLATCGPGFAADLKEMVGTWRWRDFTLDVKQCQQDSVCAKVVAGPENVGLDVFTSKLVAKGEDWFGQINDPETRATYNTRFHQVDKDRWRLDGCTSANVCLSGEFVRAR